MHNLQYICRRGVYIIAFLLFSWMFAVLISWPAHRIKMLLGIVVLAGIIVLKKRMEKRVLRISYDRAVKVMSFVFFVLQIYVMYNIFFETGWDAGIKVIPAAERIALNGDLEFLKDPYFSTYPNNLLLITIFAAVLKINYHFGVFLEDYYLMAIVILNCMISTVSAYLIYKTGKKLLGEEYAFWGWLLGTCMLVFSPWNVICYSDPMALFFPVLIFWIYFREEMSPVKKYSLIFLLGYIGISIKPQVGIAVIAIVCIQAVKHVREFREKTFLKRMLKITVISLTAILVLSKLLDTVYKLEGFEIDREKSFGIGHYLMMGLNKESMGQFSDDDVAFSEQFLTREERNKADLREAGKRIKELGAGKLVKHLSRKLLITYGSGTFAWGREGNFYMEYKREPNLQAAVRLRSLYYSDGSKYWLFSGAEQILWFMVLMLVYIKIIFGVWNRKREEDPCQVLVLALTGLMLFELLFEARARYLYAYVPVYILAAMSGLKALSERLGSGLLQKK